MKCKLFTGNLVCQSFSKLAIAFIISISVPLVQKLEEVRSITKLQLSPFPSIRERFQRSTCIIIHIFYSNSPSKSEDKKIQDQRTRLLISILYSASTYILHSEFQHIEHNVFEWLGGFVSEKALAASL